jgi:hypothetical protein
MIRGSGTPQGFIWIPFMSRKSEPETESGYSLVGRLVPRLSRIPLQCQMQCQTKGDLMKQVSDIVRAFFEDFERGSNTPNPEIIASQYDDTFVFAGPQGVQVVKKDDFLKALPKRDGFFKAVGLTSSGIQSLEETRLDDNYVLVKAHWNMRFEKDQKQSVVVEIAATYVLYQQGSLLRIVLQLDHQDFMKRVQDLGLLS